MISGPENMACVARQRIGFFKAPHSALQVCGAFFRRARLLERLSADARAELDFQAPAPRECDAVTQIIQNDRTRRGDDGDGIP